MNKVLFKYLSLIIISGFIAVSLHPLEIHIEDNELLNDTALSRPKIGLALSGGGARGFAHVGVLKVIDELGIKVDYITGTSIGAFIGGLYAIGYSALEIEQIITSVEWETIADDSINRRDFDIGEKRWKEYYNSYFNLDDSFVPILPQGFINGHRLINYLFDYTYAYSHIDDFSSLPIPFAAVASDLLTGETVVYQSGSLAEAIRASITVPSLFKPFAYGDRLLIDGGIKMNLPTSVVSEMGAETVIGVKVTSDLRGLDRLTSPVTVLDQVVNISSMDQKLYSGSHTDILIKPELKGFVATDFSKQKEIIAAGEKAAREALENLIAAINDDRDSLPNTLPERITLNRIEVRGNDYLSTTKILEYSGLSTDKPLTKHMILDGVENTYRTDLFNTVYPLIRETEEGYSLILNVEERNRKKIGFNLRYNENDDVTFGTILEMRNYLGRNSTLITALDLGGKREFLIDYVKNFGRQWGAYFRFFPYINEHTLYFYDADLNKTISTKSLEYGASLGLGGLFNNSFIIEPYIYSYYKELYRDISPFDIDEQMFSSGIGLKFYHETLNKTVFPTSGNELFLKYSHSNKEYLSDYSYDKFYGRVQTLLPIYKSDSSQEYSQNKLRKLSLRLQLEYGTYMHGDIVELDPFYVGGLDSFIGMRQDQKKIDPIFKVATAALRANIVNNFFLDVQVNVANVSALDSWVIDEDTEVGAGVVIGYKTFLAPFRLGIGFTSDMNPTSYISIGYNFDAFEFSRR